MVGGVLHGRPETRFLWSNAIVGLSDRGEWGELQNARGHALSQIRIIYSGRFATGMGGMMYKKPKQKLVGALSVAALALSALVGVSSPAAATDVGTFRLWTHVQNYGWTDNAGTVSLGLRLEAVRIFQKTGNRFCGRAHVATIGWQPWQCTSSANRQITLGTEGRSLGIEAIEVYTPGYNFGLSGHVQNIGDVSSRSSCAGCKATIGTTGRGLRLESFGFAPYNW